MNRNIACKVLKTMPDALLSKQYVLVVNTNINNKAVFFRDLYNCSIALYCLNIGNSSFKIYLFTLKAN